MGSTFNPQILADKLAKLNNSQQSIETLSHWCIFHMSNAKQVVETWSRQFHCSPPDQRLAYLYLANDILQNSRRKGAEYVGEFWRVLPVALRDVIKNGDDSGRNAAFRLINIWDERKVFGSRGHILKEEFATRHSENGPRVGRQAGLKLRHGMGNTLDKIVSGYEVVYGGQLDEDDVLKKCRNAISCMEKVEMDICRDMNSGPSNGSGILGELEGQHAALKECIEQIKLLETSRASLVSQLREALQDQEFRLDQVRSQLKAAQLLSEQTPSICQQLLNPNNVPLPDNQLFNEARSFPVISKGNGSVETELSGPIVYTRQVPSTEQGGDGVEQDDPKSAAAAIAAQITSSSSSAQMLTFVLSTLSQEGVTGSDNDTAAMKETLQAEYPPEKRPKLEDDQSFYIPPPPQQSPPPLPPLPYPDNLQSNGSAAGQPIVSPVQQPPPPTSPPPLPIVPPLPPYAMPQFMQAGPASNMQPFTYGPNPQQLPLAVYPPGPPLSGMPPFAAAPPGNPYPNFHARGIGFYNQPASMTMTPVSRQ